MNWARKKQRIMMGATGFTLICALLLSWDAIVGLAYGPEQPLIDVGVVESLEFKHVRVRKLAVPWLPKTLERPAVGRDWLEAADSHKRVWRREHGSVEEQRWNADHKDWAPEWGDPW